MSGVLTNYPSRLVIARNGRCYPLTKRKRRHGDENRDSPERDMVNPSSEDSYMWPIRGAL